MGFNVRDQIHGCIMGMQGIQSQDELVCDSGNNHPSVNSTNTSFIKCMSMISLIPKWSGVANSMNVLGFLDAVEGVVRLQNWLDADMVQAAAMKLADIARTFYSGCKKLHNPSITWVHFKEHFSGLVLRCAYRPIPLLAITNG